MNPDRDSAQTKAGDRLRSPTPRRLAITARMLTVLAFLLVPLLCSASRGPRQPSQLTVGGGTARSEGIAQPMRSEPANTDGGTVGRPKPALDPVRLEEQLRAYRTRAPKTVLELQPFRYETTAPVEREQGAGGTATLVNLNPTINAWYVLELSWPGETAPRSYHLENNDPTGRNLVLDASYSHGLVIVDDQSRAPCDLWSATARMTLKAASRLPRAYVPLCHGAVALRNRTHGHRTAKERVADFLRDNIWLGEELTVLVRDSIFRDAYLSRPSEEPGRHSPRASQAIRTDRDAPLPAQISCDDPSRCFRSTEIGIELGRGGRGAIAMGDWYPAAGSPYIFVSAMQPSLVSAKILAGDRDAVDDLDEVEADALAYLVAFDLHRFDVGFELGTDHPRVVWSDRVPRETKDPRLPGPDGIGDVQPLAATGMINPALRSRAVAAFTAGFKRSHGAFKWSSLAHKNQGSHYGFVENGVVLSKLQPSLSTLVVYNNGWLDLKTWSAADETRLSEIRFARQNGVPILERDESSGTGVPGPLVTQWGPGNWSGSVDRKLRTLRAGLCLQQNADSRYLIYGYFSSATPSAMARVFQAYNCSYAMHLDMNALEHTYLGLYRTAERGLVTEHLVEGMEVLDESYGGEVVPRFLGYADNRDFFYLTRREGSVQSG